MIDSSLIISSGPYLMFPYKQQTEKCQLCLFLGFKMPYERWAWYWGFVEAYLGKAIAFQSKEWHDFYLWPWWRHYILILP